MKLCWLDIRNVNGAREAIIEEAVHQRVDAVVAADPADLETLPPTVKKVLFPQNLPLPEKLTPADLVIVEPGRHGEPAELAQQHPDVEFGRFVEIADADSLEEACRAARHDGWSLLYFRDPTKIPLEIVLAAAAGSNGSIITQVADVEEAEIVFGVLEHGSEGVMLAPRTVGEATELKAAAVSRAADLDLVELEVTGIRRVGMGERACVDTCTNFGLDEGILVGSHSTGMILCCSETHPLPYMPTRPFRVNAGALHSYTLSADGRTNYLSELRSGGRVLAVDAKGKSRIVTVGRVKIETRPLLAIDAVAPSGVKVNLIVQDDWHVRVLGPGGTVLNVTELTEGTKVLGCLPVEQRHVGYPIDEFCIEK
ncbi:MULTISPECIES: 3-dehydroquinate synthase II [Streptomyces]|uniref:3-dehydroquinate synthase n=1 Tax=Streptomyces griseoflavus Tu4000 TaxID=467200 RepID=D9XNL6_9ACTN|nr:MULTISPECIES: 3-dehydroquinate synthase II [Streptomyces]EFL38169.1 3-dehydroquinate synthase [Streptomyces griseoflavus Tu4000]TQL19187.1 3-amino-4-hydroxybenzoic acid synthase [Streptomyces sp. SLBN-134]